MSEQGKRLLHLKGVEAEEDTEAAVVPEQVLEQFQKRKADKNGVFDDLELNWNPDETLNRMVAYKNGLVLYELHFAWNSDGTLSKIMRM